MKRIVLTILIVLVVAVLAVCGLAAAKSGEFHVTRSLTMAAPPADLFAQVNDFRKWNAWSPWDTMDPNMKRTYSGEASGKGAVYTWEGNGNVGEGKMTITDTKPDERIDIDIEFVKPMPGKSKVLFTFKPEGNGTNVTWSMDGKSNFVGKVFSVFMSMDTMIGSSFEQGLASLKSVVEKKAA